MRCREDSLALSPRQFLGFAKALALDAGLRLRPGSPAIDLVDRVMYLPEDLPVSLPDGFELKREHLRILLEGWVVHEAAGHGVHTRPRRLLHDMQDELARRPGLHGVFMVLEDARIELAASADYAGARTMLDELLRLMVELGRVRDGSRGPIDELETFLCFWTRVHTMGQDFLQAQLDPVEAKLRDRLGDPLVDRIVALARQCGDEAESAPECMDFARRILDEIESVAEGNPPSGSDQGDSEESEESEDSGEAGGAGAPGSDDSDISEGSDGSEDSGSDEADGSSTGSSDDEAGQDSTQGADSSESGESGDDSGQGNSSGGDDSEEAEASGSASSKEDGGGSASDSSGDGNTGEDDNNGTPSGVDPGAQLGAQAIVDGEGQHGGDPAMSEVEEMLRQAVREIQQAGYGSQGGPGTGGDGGIFAIGSEPEIAARLQAGIRGPLARMQSALNTVLRARDNERVTAGPSGSRISIKHAPARMRTGNPNIWRTKRVRPNGYPAVMVLLDLSGSMEDVIPRVAEIGLAFGNALGQMRVRHGVYGFGCRDGFNEGDIVRISGFDEGVCKDRFGGLLNANLGGTPLQGALNVLGPHLLAQRAKSHVLITVTDGMPINPRGTRDRVLELRKEGVRTLGIGLGRNGCDAIDQLGMTSTIKAESVEALAGALFGFAQDLAA